MVVPEIAVFYSPRFVVLFLPLNTGSLGSVLFFRLAMYRSMSWEYFWYYHRKFLPYYLLFLGIGAKNTLYPHARRENKYPYHPSHGFINQDVKYLPSCDFYELFITFCINFFFPEVNILVKVVSPPAEAAAYL